MRCVDSVTVYPDSITIQSGSWYYGARAEVCPASADITEVEWYSDNTSVASVNASSGYIYARNPGTARIYARATDGSEEYGYLTVSVRGNIYVSSVQLNRTSMSLEKGEQAVLTATVYPTNATNKTILWRSTSTGVITVSDGVVTAKKKGSAYIYAEAADDSGAYARCLVRVTEGVLVTSVVVSPSSKTMIVGGSAYLQATVYPENATNTCVVWFSDNDSVATVNEISGLVMAQGVGTVRITARATDGSGKSGECLLKVNAPTAVTGVEVCPESLTMNVGEAKVLCYNIFPSNATNQSVTWYSSNENVATVDLRSGRVQAKMAGTTTITATTADGGYSASCTIIVNWEAVVIEKIGNSDYSRIVFKNGKIWNCINQDVANNYNLNENDPLTHKFYENVYQTKVIDKENGNIYYSLPLKNYDNEEIKLIYRIDPLGLAGYIKTFAFESMRIRDDNSDDNDNVNNNDSDVVKMLKYKDDIFCLLFNRKPRHYERDFSGTWYEVSDDYYLDTIFSESEFLFGQHVIYDAYTILELISLAIDVACIALQCPMLSRLSNLKAIGLIQKYYPLAHSVAKSVLNEDFQSFVAAIADGLIDDDALGEEFISETGHKMINFKLDWAVDVLSFSSDLRALSDAFNSGPHFYKEVYTQCINDLKYTIMIRMADNKLVSLAEINKVIQ